MQKITKTGLEKVQNFTRVQSTRAKVFAVKSQKKMAVASPKARSTEKKAVGGVHETGRIPFFLFRVTFAGTVAGLARRAVGYIYIYIYTQAKK